MKAQRISPICLLVALMDMPAALSTPVVPPQGGLAVEFKEPVWLTGIKTDADGAISAEFPQPVSSDHFKVKNAGYWLGRKDKPNQVFYYFALDVTRHFDQEVHTRMLLADPEHPDTPIRYEDDLKPSAGSVGVTHGPLAQVQRGQDYMLTFEVFADQARTELLERVEQKIIAPFDNTSGCVTLPDPLKRVLMSTFTGPRGQTVPLEKMILLCDR